MNALSFSVREGSLSMSWGQYLEGVAKKLWTHRKGDAQVLDASQSGDKNKESTINFRVEQFFKVNENNFSYFHDDIDTFTLPLTGFKDCKALPISFLAFEPLSTGQSIFKVL